MSLQVDRIYTAAGDAIVDLGGETISWAVWSTTPHAAPAEVGSLLALQPGGALLVPCIATSGWLAIWETNSILYGLYDLT